METISQNHRGSDCKPQSAYHLSERCQTVPHQCQSSYNRKILLKCSKLLEIRLEGGIKITHLYILQRHPGKPISNLTPQLDHILSTITHNSFLILVISTFATKYGSVTRHLINVLSTQTKFLPCSLSWTKPTQEPQTDHSLFR